jgi:hypothetical protein
MKNAGLIFIGMALSLSCLNSSSRTAAQEPSKGSTATLYSIQKHRGERRNFCLNFQSGPNASLRADCDLVYGSLYAGEDFDWFQSASSQGARSVIKDLGVHDWSTSFEVPVVAPLAKLKPGERREVTIDVSGADGAPGKPGAPGAGAASDSSEFPSEGGPVPGDVAPRPPTAQRPTKPWQPKHDGKPKIDPLFVKAIVGHIYVIHVVDDARDFYALFRVEALERGDNCTVSWKLIPEPLNQSGKSASR